MDLSLIYVHYKVPYFLRQSIHSAINTAVNLSLEIIVVDNSPRKEARNFFQSLHPNLVYIEAAENLGFGRACNLGLKKAKGQCVLFCNPDTIILPKVLQFCVNFINAHQEVGFVGVRMVDGENKFLIESKRAFPNPKSAFFKLIGLSSLFSKSPYFAAYNLGNVDPLKDSEVDILCGAFMMAKTKIVKELGGFDEQYFMYGEDIDLSWSAIKHGYRNYYLGSNAIVHYKGLSTNKNSVLYVHHFYNAMQIFYDKYHQKALSSVFHNFIDWGIRFRSIFSFLKSIFARFFPILVRFFLIFSTLTVIKNIWAIHYFGNANYYNRSLINYHFLFYALIWILSIKLLHIKRKDGNQRYSYPILLGTLLILSIYALLPENLRTSRALILIGAFSSYWLITFLDFIKNRLSNNSYTSSLIALIGEKNEIENYIRNSNSKEQQRHLVIDSNKELKSTEFLQFLNEICKLENIHSLIFCNPSLQTGELINCMQRIGVQKKYALYEGVKLLTLNNHESMNYLQIRNLYNISTSYNQLIKRLFDIICSIFVLLTLPLISIFRFTQFRSSFSEIIQVFLGKMTMVSYIDKDSNMNILPELKNGIFELSFNPKKESNIHEINATYAKSYSVWMDVKITLQNLIKL